MQRTCEVCDRPFAAKSSRARYCSDRCRKRRSRTGVVVPFTGGDAKPPPRGPVAEATIRLLEEADEMDTPLGANALKLAEKLDEGGDTGSSTAALSKQHLTVTTEILRGMKRVANPLDDLRERRERRRRGA